MFVRIYFMKYEAKSHPIHVSNKSNYPEIQI